MEDLELNDAELLASLEAQNEVVGSVQDSGYGTLQESSSVSSSVRSQFSLRYVNGSVINLQFELLYLKSS